MFIQDVINKIKGWFNMLTSDTLKSKVGIEVAISSEMSTALDLWSNMYSNRAPWLTKDIKSMNLPASIAGELANLVTIEMSVEIEGDTPRAAYLQSQVDKVVTKLRQMIEYGNAKGGLIMKPFPNGDQLDVDFVQADQFLPVSFDANGNITAVVFVDQQTKEKNYYTRLEYHTFNSKDKTVTIKNMAYKSSNTSDIGQPIALTEFEPWATLKPEAGIKNVKAPLYGYYRFPQANNIDTTSPLGVSCYARAVGYIEDADRLWSNLVWEFESGKRAIFADVMAFDRDDDGLPILPDKRLYRALANSSNNIGEDGFFHEFTPEFRNAAIQSGLDAILKKIEYTCGLAYGTISDPQTVDKTATEIVSSKQRTFSTIKDMRKAVTACLTQLLYAMDVWATLNKLEAPGKFTTVCKYDDSVITDQEAQKNQDMREVNARLLSRVEYRMRNHGEDEETAIKKIKAIDKEQADELESQDSFFGNKK
jgi:A118 family predicted phage portal protein